MFFVVIFIPEIAARLLNSAVQRLYNDQILASSIDGSGYNENYGLLGSNKATEDSLKLFPVIVRLL